MGTPGNAHSCAESASRAGPDLAGTLTLTRSRELNEKLHALIPGGAHTYAKGDDQFPEGLAPVISHGRGCRVWDVDGNEYIEYGQGLRSVTLGHGFPRVVDAVRERIGGGTNFGRPSALELETAESFVGMIEAADMVKFTKDGSTANTAAVRLARAFTGRELVAICSDHPFYSYDDWAMVAHPMRAGIPAYFEAVTLGFRYNDISSVESLLQRFPGRIACFILEPERSEPPRNGFLHRLQELVQENGALLVLDENVTGFRWDNGGGQAVHGICPDLSTWGKGIANGFALAALAGRREIMELGGLNGRERVYLVSTTHGAEHAGLAAGLATMQTYRDEPVVATMLQRGERLRSGLQTVIEARGLGHTFSVFGKSSCLYYGTSDVDGCPSQEFRTLFLQETMRRGLMAPSFVVSYAHSDDVIDRSIEIVDQALAVYAKALDGGIERFLEGRPVRPVYRVSN